MLTSFGNKTIMIETGADVTVVNESGKKSRRNAASKAQKGYRDEGKKQYGSHQCEGTCDWTAKGDAV